MDRPAKQSNYTDMGTKNDDVEDHAKMVDKDLSNIFQYAGSLPQPSGVTVANATGAGDVVAQLNALLTALRLTKIIK